MTTAYGRAAGEAAFAVGLRVVEGVVPVDADDAGVADEAAEELVQAEGVGVAGDVVLVLGGLHDGEAAAAGVARRVDAGDRVEPGGGLVESDGVLLGQVASPLPERLGHEGAGHGVAGAGAEAALIEGGAVALVADRLDRGGAGGEREAPRVVLDVAAEAADAFDLLDALDDRLHGNLRSTSSPPPLRFHPPSADASSGIAARDRKS